MKNGKKLMKYPLPSKQLQRGEMLSESHISSCISSAILLCLFLCEIQLNSMENVKANERIAIYEIKMITTSDIKCNSSLALGQIGEKVGEGRFGRFWAIFGSDTSMFTCLPQNQVSREPSHFWQVI